MTAKPLKAKKKRVAWGITGSGEKLHETIEMMKELKRLYGHEVDINVYLSKAGEQVAKYYRLLDDLKMSFGKVAVEVNANSPFLAGQLQLGLFKFLLIAPATSNTVAKIAVGIADSMLSNAAAMALKARIAIYVLPSDWKEGTVVTKLPDGRELNIHVRKEDADNTRKLKTMENVFVIEHPEAIHEIFNKHFDKEKPAKPLF
ncbi:archaeoflavoprotein AfpA [Candidatus Bathyarchaeota archaeon]|nr:archaeoflavoprotein AfpA [Candidatus Bathyarchaeota archaeon]